jgi:CheY-like chemotaxis protein
MDVPRVLIISADPHERQRAASALLLRGDADVIESASGAEAAEMLRAGAFDVLVIDGDLRPKGGFSWLYELRAQAELQGIQRPPAVVMTARDQDQFLADWSGAEAVVSKPVDGFRMADVVADLAGAAPAPA